MTPLNHSMVSGVANRRMRIGRVFRALSPLILGVLLSFASFANTAWAQSDPSQAAGQGSSADTATNSKPKPVQSSRARKKADGVWHHFGESDSAATRPRSRPRPEPGVWHHFGSNDSGLRSNASPARKPAESAPGKSAPLVSKPGERVPVASASPHIRPVDNNSSGHASASHASDPNPRRSASRRQYDAIRARDLEHQMLTLINRNRRNAGVPPLRWNAKLAEVALAHSRDMIRHDYFSHVDPTGKSVGGRVTAAGIAWQAVGENIAIAPTISEAETEFMDEPSGQRNHRWNILNSGYTEVGVGIARGPDGELYVTQDFMKASPGK